MNAIASMSDLSPWLRIIGRGSHGRRDLAREEAAACLTALLEHELSEAQLGAWWIAMRLKGESGEELAGFTEALRRTQRWQLDAAQLARPCWVLPAYNGARRLLNAVPLLARALVERGAWVLVHGITHDPTRLTTYALWQALGWPIAGEAAQAEKALRRNGLVFVPIAALQPGLARLLAWRWRIGVRSTPHTLAKLIEPIAGAWRAVPVTHADYLDRLSAFLAATGARAVVYRGAEGEAAWHPRRATELQVCASGQRRRHTWAAQPHAPCVETAELDTSVRLLHAMLSGSAALPECIHAQAEAFMEIAGAEHSPT
ncbi:MAG: DNA-binding protein YbiB [Casimicrobiaceae bacterium]|nr:DNA-binding protein YbiB [Casimicrobiaceae bacterium]MCX8098386.1 DNA-binding protein YbiB [Casimicrobiaceae bacterium]MDW8312550.1 DNA-binding protein YbiB [Burkholderiales bacterium]